MYMLNDIQLFIMVGYFISELRSVTCHTGSQRYLHPTQVNTPRLNPSQTGWYTTYVPGGMEGWVHS